MPTFRYVTLDVFTDTRFGGNQLAVFPDATGLDAAQMQRITAEFNYSEVTFVLPPENPANTARVRIFEPTAELPFAGHPNVGTGFVLGRIGTVFGQPVPDAMRFEEPGGIVAVELLRTGGVVSGARIRAPQTLQVRATLDPETVAACASLAAGDIATDSHPPVMASVGLTFALAEVASVEALGKARPNPAAFGAADARYRQPDVSFSLFLYARQPGSTTLRTRMFAPLSNIFEDPATGSASAALGAYLTSLKPQADIDEHLTLRQGVEMERPSTIDLHVAKRGGTVRSVDVGGPCVTVMRGEIEL
jgi:trans-2,3-dihydro-3-hydroxyanthranilate isomerase